MPLLDQIKITHFTLRKMLLSLTPFNVAVLVHVCLATVQGKLVFYHSSPIYSIENLFSFPFLEQDCKSLHHVGLNTVDGIHPNDAGCVLMANAWYAAITDAGNRGWIKAPVSGASIPPEHNGTSSTGGAFSPSSGGVCSTFPYWQPPVTIAYGVGGVDGPFVQSWSLTKAIALGVP